MEFIQSVLENLNQVFEAGIAITALSLFIRSMSFNLRDRVSRTFAIILACVVVNFAGEAVSGSVSDPDLIEVWLRINWIGILFLPSAILHFADALLETTGRPSRGRRRRLILASYGLSFGLLVSSFTANFLGPVVVKEGLSPHFKATPFTVGFAVYYLGAMLVGGRMIWRAYRRTRLRVSRRRIQYMFVGVFFLAIGSYPYLQLGTGLVQNIKLPFLFVVFIGNIGIFMTLIMMAYAVGFFGVSWPDRVVRSRLLKWLLRGPSTVFVVLLLITITYRLGNIYGTPSSVAIPVVTALTVLFLEHLITLVFPIMERWFFHGGEQQNLALLQTLSERMITTRDLRQYLEAILASVCDKFQVSTAFIAALEESGMEMVVNIGKELQLNQNDLDQVVLEKVVTNHNNGEHEVFSWGDFWILPLRGSEDDDLLGLLGVMRLDEHRQEKGLFEDLELLGNRASMGLEDRRVQQQVFEGLETLRPKIDLLQRMRAAVSFDQSGIMGDLEEFENSVEMSRLVKDALSHYWGGPKLSESPLIDLKIVQESMEDHDGNPTNAMRAILKKAVEQVKPEDSERRFTAEWILYNILEMKFMEGRKVREIALRLAMSEADLYRKQRVAIEAVAQAIMEMELKAREA